MSTHVPVVTVPIVRGGRPVMAGAVFHETVDSVHEFDTGYQLPPETLPSVTYRWSFTDVGALVSPLRVNFTNGRYSAVGLCSFITVLVP